MRLASLIRMARFEFQAAICYAMHGAAEQAVAHVDRYVLNVRELFSSDILLLHGDAYFSKIEEWFEAAEGGTIAPRNRQLVLAEVKQSLDIPLFAALEGRVCRRPTKATANKLKREGKS